MRMKWLACILSLISVQSALASEVSVDDRKIPPVDSFARVEDWFGHPAIELFLFAAPLTVEQKQKIAVERYPGNVNFDMVAAGNHPVLQLLFFFQQGANVCSKNDLEGYTAVFEQSKSFPFDTAAKGPINWSFSRANTTLEKIGITKLACSFENGGTVDVAVKNQWLVEADAKDSGQILPPGRASMLFGWDIDTAAKVIVPSQVAVAAPALAISNEMIKDASILWVSKLHMLSVRLFRRQLTDEERKAPASYPPRMPYPFFLGAISVFYKGEPLSFADEKPDRVSVSILTKEGPSAFHQYTYDAKGELRVTGSPKLGAPVSIGSQDTGPADARVSTPPATWGIKASGAILQVH